MSLFADELQKSISSAPIASTRIVDPRRWTVTGDKYHQCGDTVETVPSGCYQVNNDDRGIHLEKHTYVSDSLIKLPDSVSNRVLAAVTGFWDAEANFRKYGVTFKRGILLWGQAGVGKSGAIMLAVQDVIARGGIVLINRMNGGSIGLLSAGISILRAIEPKRPIVVVIEDIEEVIEDETERSVLSMLDGEHQTDGICYIATTNFPEKLGARLLKRPSRFDEVIKAEPPTEEARAVYFKHMLSEDTPANWIKDTDDMPLSFLRELVVGVKCLGREYADVLARLKELNVKPESVPEFERTNTVGFGGKK